MAAPPAKRACTAAASALSELEFFSAWFCPYAQRAWIALEHHKLPYKKIEALVLDKPGEEATSYNKHPRLLELNPKGLVPTISEGPGCPPVYESLVCVEYADELATGRGDAETLLPGGPSERAALRLKADWVNRQCVSPFYQILVRKDQGERQTAFLELGKSLDELEAMAAAAGGPFLAGKQLTIVDVAFIPWAHRIMVCKIIERFRGEGFVLDMATRPLLSRWLDLVMALPAVKATLADPEELSKTYKRYADGTAQSKVCEAVKQGKAAHSV